jgi:hypothetical protein
VCRESGVAASRDEHLKKRGELKEDQLDTASDDIKEER